tara:strand:+ start:487 stop:1407 length:921 start_codon:yes stop_codon:yes gene_type:complete
MFSFKSNFFVYLIIIPFMHVSSLFSANLPNLPLDIDNQNFCVKERDAFDRDYHHVMIIIDRTTFLDEQQIEWISNNLFDPSFVKEFRPYTRFSLLYVDDKSPQIQELEYSKCRPKSGKKSKQWDDEKFTRDENEMIVSAFFDRFLNGKNDIGFTNLGSTIGSTVSANNSWIFETMIHALTTRSLEFRNKDYDKRTLIIVSDLMQHSKEFSLYRECKAKTNIKQMSKCPSLNKALEKNKVLDEYLTFTRPKDSADNLDVHLYFLNFEHEANREISVSLINFWGDYFRKIGISIPENIEDWTTWQTRY